MTSYAERRGVVIGLARARKEPAALLKRKGNVDKDTD
jgi:hypothetical protein